MDFVKIVASLEQRTENCDDQGMKQLVNLLMCICIAVI